MRLTFMNGKKRPTERRLNGITKIPQRTKHQHLPGLPPHPRPLERNRVSLFQTRILSSNRFIYEDRPSPIKTHTLFFSFPSTTSNPFVGCHHQDLCSSSVVQNRLETEDKQRFDLVALRILLQKSHSGENFNSVVSNKETLCSFLIDQLLRLIDIHGLQRRGLFISSSFVMTKEITRYNKFLLLR